MGVPLNQMILLVEDNSDDEALTMRALRKTVPLPTVVVARDGAEALDFLFGTGDYEGRDLSTNPLFVLLDLKLPKVSGLEVLRQIRGNERTKTIPIIVFTSSTEYQDILDCYTFGANSYVCKPVDYQCFADNIKQIMGYWLNISKSLHPIPTKLNFLPKVKIGLERSTGAESGR
jgi:two-component system, response regulator